MIKYIVTFLLLTNSQSYYEPFKNAYGISCLYEVNTKEIVCEYNCKYEPENIESYNCEENPKYYEIWNAWENKKQKIKIGDHIL